MSKIKKISNNTKEFLLTLFTDSGEYEEIEINGYHLVKHFDGNTNGWTVSVYTPQSWINYKRANDQWKERQ